MLNNEPRKRCGLAALVASAGLAMSACAVQAQSPTRAGSAGQDIVIDDVHVFPESVTADARGRLYAGSLKGIIYRSAPGGTKATAWIKPDAQNQLLWVLGVLADDKSNTLWACTAAAPFRDPPALGVSALLAFNLKTGALKGRYPLPEPASACNDITIAKDGTAFVAETTNGRIFTLKPGAKAVSLFVEDKALLVGVDGIAFSQDGLLYVNNVRQNTMLRVNRDAKGAYRSLTKLAVSAPLNGPDGLRLYKGSSFLQAEGPAEKVTLVTISGDKAEVKVIDDKTGGSAGVAHIGDMIYTAAGKINYLFDPKLKGQDPGAFVIRATPLGGAK